MGEWAGLAKNPDGDDLALFAQVNLHEMADLIHGEQWVVWPKKGILQFFIDPKDDVWGLNFNDLMEQKKWRVIFWDDPSFNKYKKIIIDPSAENPENLPASRSGKMVFSLEKDIIGTTDEYHFEKLGLSGDHQEDFYEEIDEQSTNNGHKIGGFATFTQSDPRCSAEYKDEEWVLLLQIDSDDDIMWGDCGVGNWFIPLRSLEKRDFTNVLYNWDCC